MSPNWLFCKIVLGFIDIFSYFRLFFKERFLIISPAVSDWNSTTLVFGSQKTKFANPAPCKPTICSALLNKLTWSTNLRSLKVKILKPFFFKKFITSCSFTIILLFLWPDVESDLSI